MKIQRILPEFWDKAWLDGILDRLDGRKILVFGDLGVDRYTIGTVERISPEAPVPVVAVQEETLKLGLAANVADNIRALGARPVLVGVVGHDRGAEDFRSLLARSHISSSTLTVDPTRRTVLKDRVVSDRQQIVRVDYENTHPLSPAIEQKIIRQIKRLISKCDGVIVEDYAKGLLTKRLISSIFLEARKCKKFAFVDPHLRTPLEMYRGATALTPNIKEAEALSGIAVSDEKSLIQAGMVLMRKTGARWIVITRGKDGMAVFTRGKKQCTLIPTCAREVYDVSGAGDTVISVLALAMASGASIEESAILGNLAAGVEVGKRGTATVSVSEVRVALEFFGNVRG